MFAGPHSLATIGTWTSRYTFELWPSPREGLVFTTRTGEAHNPSGLRSILRRHSAGKTRYQLRHSFAQQATGRDVPVEVLARLLGRTNTKTTGLYYQVRDKRALAAAKTLKLTETNPG